MGVQIEAAPAPLTVSKGDPIVTTVLCHGCKVMEEAPGTPYTEESVFQAAISLGWTVIGKRCYCLRCAPRGGPKR